MNRAAQVRVGLSTALLFLSIQGDWLTGIFWPVLSKLPYLPGVTMLGLTGVWAWFGVRRLDRDRYQTGLGLFIVAYLAILAVSAIWFDHSFYPAEKCFSVWLVLIAGLVVGIVTSDAALAWLYAGCGHIALAIAAMPLGYSIATGSLVRAVGFLPSPNGLYVLSGVTLVMGTWISIARPKNKAAGYVAVAIGLAALLAAGSRIGPLAALIAIASLAGTAKREGRRALITTGIGCLLVCGFTFASRHWVAGATEATARGDVGRRWAWEEGWKWASDRAFLGSGPGTFSLVRQGVRDGKPEQTPLSEPKNLYLFYLDEGGAGGVILLAGIAFLSALILVRRGSRGFLTAGGFLLLCGLVDTPFGTASRPEGTALLGMIVGTTLSSSREEDYGARGGNVRGPRISAWK